MVNTSTSRRSRRTSMVTWFAAFAVLAWGAAAFALSGGSGASATGTAGHFDDHDVFLAVPQADGTLSYVRIDAFMFDSADGNTDTTANDAAIAGLVARFPGAAQLTEGEFSAAYVTSGFKWATGVANWSYNGSGAPAGVAGSASGALMASAATWGQAGANFHFTGGAATGAGTGACGGGTDGQNTLGWAGQAGNILAVTCSWYGGGSGGFANAAEFDMQIDPEWNWTTGGAIQIDLQSVVTHEFGHALGLNHTSDSSAVMYASYPSGSNKRTLMADDISGIKAIYGATGGGQPTNTPTPTATPTRTSTPTATATSTTPGGTPTNSPTTAPTSSPTSAPSATQTPPTGQPTATSTTTPSPSATATTTPLPSSTATATPTAGSTPPAPSLPLVPGSNLLAWPGTHAMPPAVALAGQGTVIRIVYSWDPVSGTWQRYGPNLPAYLNNLLMLEPGHAYWFIASGSTHLTFEP